MSRVALVSDIHGNVTALEAVLADIERRGIERIICLGDLVGKGPRSDLAVDICRDRCEFVLRGNWDDFIGEESPTPVSSWYQAQLGSERLAYVGSLPLCVDRMVSGRRLRLFHASEVSVHQRVLMQAGEERHLAMFRSTDLTGPGPTPDIVGYGDIHRAFVMSYRTLHEGRADRALHQTLFNTGSVGNPLDSFEASYAVIEGDFDGNVEPVRSVPVDPARHPFSIQLLRVAYDIERELEVARAMDMPNYEAYEFELRTGMYAGALRSR